MLHPAYFLLLVENEASSARELALSGEVSEWLFNSGFWDRFNEGHGTFFGQYEEEQLPVNLALVMADKLHAELDSLETVSCPTLRFCYGWDAQKNEMHCSVEIDALRKEIGQLIEFLNEAAASNSDVYCQL